LSSQKDGELCVLILPAPSVRYPHFLRHLLFLSILGCIPGVVHAVRATAKCRASFSGRAGCATPNGLLHLATSEELPRPPLAVGLPFETFPVAHLLLHGAGEREQLVVSPGVRVRLHPE
jgi:hypothetical protein